MNSRRLCNLLREREQGVLLIGCTFMSLSLFLLTAGVPFEKPTDA